MEVTCTITSPLLDTDGLGLGKLVTGFIADKLLTASELLLAAVDCFIFKTFSIVSNAFLKLYFCVLDFFNVYVIHLYVGFISTKIYRTINPHGIE